MWESKDMLSTCILSLGQFLLVTQSRDSLLIEKGDRKR